MSVNLSNSRGLRHEALGGIHRGGGVGGAADHDLGRDAGLDQFRLEDLHINGGEYGLDVLGYCLMTNHVHLAAILQEEDSLPKGSGGRSLATAGTSTVSTSEAATCGRGDSTPVPSTGGTGGWHQEG